MVPTRQPPTAVVRRPTAQVFPLLRDEELRISLLTGTLCKAARSEEPARAKSIPLMSTYSESYGPRSTYVLLNQDCPPLVDAMWRAVTPV